MIRAFMHLAVAGLGLTLLAGCEIGAKDSAQTGYRGAGLDQIVDRSSIKAAVAIPPAPYPLPPDGGPTAGQAYQNVRVLGNLSKERFDHLMAEMNQWVAPPEQGCNYCHNPENMASDEKYTKIVARRMVQMTQNINSRWASHVKQTGVTCYTCHRGQPVPANIWFTNPGPTRPGGFIARNNGQNLASPSVGLSSLPYDTLTEYLADKSIDNNAIRVNATTALPTSKGKPIQEAEKTFGLMIHMAEGLGVNCTFCHNTRAIADWSQSTPQRTTAWHGIRMVRDINGNFMEPLTSTFPRNRLGVLGDVPKVNCTTCHNGQNKPLNGAHVVEAYPALTKVTVAEGIKAPEDGMKAPDAPPAEPAAPQPATPAAPQP